MVSLAREVPCRFRSFSVDLPVLKIIRSDKFVYLDCFGTPAESNPKMHFAKGQLPPVNAFWSLTMYDGKNSLLVANPLNRYLINSPMLPTLKRDADGGLTIYVQKKLSRQSKGIELIASYPQ